MDEHQVHILRIQNRDREDNNVRLYSTNTGVASRKIKNFLYVIVDAFGCRKKVLNPKSSFLQKWNMIFLLSCAISLLVDPVYLYTMIINRNRSCLDLDEKLAVVTTVLSSFVDVVNIIRIIFQFRTGYLASSSGISVLVEDNKKIVRRYLSSTFLIDIISVLPLPQVVILVIVPNMKGSKVLNIKTMLKIAVPFQFITRLMQMIQLYKETKRTSQVLGRIGWTDAPVNLFLYIVSGHVSINRNWHLSCIADNMIHQQAY